MKVKVFKKEEPKEREVKLMLFEDAGKVVLATAKEDGTPEWSLLIVSDLGIEICRGVPPGLGFTMIGSRINLIGF